MPKNKQNQQLPSQADVDQFEMLRPMLDKLRNEMRELSKKKQDGVLNQLKVEMINRVLEQVKELLSKEASVQFLDLLDTDNLPTNSDVVLILSQYDAALSAFHAKYHGMDGFISRWFTQENPQSNR